MGQTPFGVNRSASRNNACHARGREWDVRQPDPGMNREIIDTLFGLFYQGVSIDCPGQVLSLSADFFQCLINRNGADRNGGVANNPFTGLMDMFPR